MPDRRLERIRESLKDPETIGKYEIFLKQLDRLVLEPVFLMNIPGNMDLKGRLQPYDDDYERWCCLLPADGGRVHFETTDISFIEDNVIVLS